ncbi:hypothetical protein C9374_013438 [Naegleria lovaniensis]|uniref:BTB domain-containing protein n=1 Tax=Naegleria lovaniensis TaxID=51637 RepID=A0AA88GVT9_NAELO|nr:uncharacterized protein C9374_013438 [Naegleria lovaniensis]KAG2391953.1 hypothetical protein C9374_013438 [Naegleria lovaniensis]
MSRKNLLDEIVLAANKRIGKSNDTTSVAEDRSGIVLETSCTTPITKHFASLFNNPCLSDFKFVLKRSNMDMNEDPLGPFGHERLNEIHVHKFVIYQSEVFKALLESNLIEQQTNEMVIEENEENIDAFIAMIAILYGSYIPCVKQMSMDHVLELLACLDKYQVKSVEKAIIDLFVQEIEQNNPNFKPSQALWLWYYALCGKGYNQVLKSNISTKYIRPLWSIQYHGGKRQEGQQDFYLFISSLDFDAFSIFLNEFCDSSCELRKVCESIDYWSQKRPQESSKTSELLRIALKRTKN